MSRGMNGWMDAGSDINWQDYGGRWIKIAPDGSYYQIDFVDMVEACGDEFDAKTYDRYISEVKRLDIHDLTEKDIVNVINSVGREYLEHEPSEEWLHRNKITLADHREMMIAEAAFDYGLGAPLYTAEGRRALSVRAEARRYAEDMIKDAEALETALARPVNAIGSTAAEMGRGDITSAMVRGIKNKDPKATLMGKIYQGTGYQTRPMKHGDAIEIDEALSGIESEEKE